MTETIETGRRGKDSTEGELPEERRCGIPRWAGTLSIG